MDTSIKPIKRLPELAPLSREHHHGLLFVWKIRQGISFKVAPERIFRYATWFWENYLKAHFHKEESALSKILPLEHPMMKRMVDDHEAIAVEFIELIESTSYAVYKRLAKVISYHIRFEERDLFNYIQKLATEMQLQDLLFDLEKDNGTVIPDWSDEFWVQNKQTKDQQV